MLTQFIAEHVVPAEPTEYILEGRRADRPRGVLVNALRKFGGSVVATSGKQRVIQQSEQTVGGFQVDLTSLSGIEAYNCSRSSALANTYFRAAGLPIPRGRSYGPKQYQDALEHFSRDRKPVAVKPSSTSRGIGITPDVRSEAQFQRSWETAATARTRLAGVPGSDRVIVEDHISGISIRAYVVGEELIAATARIPLFVVGDDLHSIVELAEAALPRRKANPLLAEISYDLDKILIDSQVSPLHVPSTGEIVLLSSRVGLPYGGLPVDVTDLICEELAGLAINAVWAIPGCPAAGVDIIAPSLESAEGAKVLQLDVEASLALHHFPWIGTPRPVAEQVAKTIIRRARLLLY